MLDVLFSQKFTQITNGAVCALVLLAGLIFFLCRASNTDFPGFFRYRAGRWAFICWLAWWVPLMITYLIETPPIATLLINDVGDLLLVLSGLVYIAGNRFDPRQRVVVFLVAALALVMAGQGVLFWMGHYAETPTSIAVLAIAPSVALSNIAILLFGWAMYARWGLTALPLLLVAAFYSMAQGPAHLDYFVVRPHLSKAVATMDSVETEIGAVAKSVDVLIGAPDSLPRGAMAKTKLESVSKDLQVEAKRMKPAVEALKALGNLRKIFFGLALGKAMLAAFSFGLFFSMNDAAPPSMDVARAWPSGERVPLNRNLTRALYGIGGAAGVAFLSAAVSWLLGRL